MSVLIETPRLAMTPLVASDWPLFLQLRTDPGVMRYVGDIEDEVAIRARFDARCVPWTPPSAHWLCLVVRDRLHGRALGLQGFCATPADNRAELGYLLLPSAQGQGFGLESLRGVTGFAFGEAGYHKLTATVTAGNMASAKMLAKAGFRLEGCLRQQFRLGGQWHDDHLYGLLAAEWQG